VQLSLQQRPGLVERTHLVELLGKVFDLSDADFVEAKLLQHDDFGQVVDGDVGQVREYPGQQCTLSIPLRLQNAKVPADNVQWLRGLHR
jgi:hypothetical protein